MTRNEFHITARHYLCILIAFFLPVYIHVVPALIGLLVLNWIAEGNFQEKITSLKNNRVAWPLFAFYFAHLIGMLWTKEVADGWFDLEVKLSFLLFPLILSSGKIEINKILLGFVYGCVAASLLCLGVASVHFFQTGENHFEYTLLSFILHPAYFSMYIDSAIAILLFSLNHNNTKEKTITYLTLPILACMVVLLSSKVGTILLGILLLIYACRQIITHKKWKLGGSILLLGFAMLFLAIKFFPYTIDRIKDGFHTFTHPGEIDLQNLESNSMRVLVWKSDFIAMKRNWLIGTGTGDMKNELVNIYLQSGYTLLAEKRLNAHSQFFQTTITLGLCGAFILLACFILPFRIAIKKKNILLLAFLTICLVNFLVESMLEVQAGVMFYAFFYSLLLFSIQDNDDSLLPSQDHR